MACLFTPPSQLLLCFPLFFSVPGSFPGAPPDGVRQKEFKLSDEDQRILGPADCPQIILHGSWQRRVLGSRFPAPLSSPRPHVAGISGARRISMPLRTNWVPPSTQPTIYPKRP